MYSPHSQGPTLSWGGSRHKELYPRNGPPRIRGGGGHLDKRTGNQELGKRKDYEDLSLEIPKDDIANDDLANWLFEYRDNLDTDIEELAVLVEKMYKFPLETRNLHEDVKGWCIELHEKTGLI